MRTYQVHEILNDKSLEAIAQWYQNYYNETGIKVAL